MEPSAFPEAMRPRWELYRRTVISDKEALVIRRSKVPLSRCSAIVGEREAQVGPEAVDGWRRENHEGNRDWVGSLFLPHNRETLLCCASRVLGGLIF